MSDKIKKFHDALDDILDRPIAYNPAFKRITGSTVAGIFLSQAWYWSKRHRDDDGWFFKSQAEWEEETGLTRSEQETARKHCLRVNVTEERLKGVPATMYYRVNKPKVYELLGVQYAEIPQTENAGFPQSSFPTNSQFAGKQQSDIPANINKESETPPMTSPENPEEEGSPLFDLFMNNISMITPIIADAIEKAEKIYGSQWVSDAIQLSGKNGAKSWNYCEKVLERWQREGRVEKKPDPKQRAAINPDKYVSGKYAEFVEH